MLVASSAAGTAWAADAPSQHAKPHKRDLSYAAYTLRVHEVRDRLVDALRRRGVWGVFALLRAMRRCSPRGELPLARFHAVLDEHRLGLAASHIALYFNELDDRRRNLVSVDRFFDTLRFALTPTTIDLLDRVFNSFKAIQSRVLASHVRARYQPQNHPDVRSGAKTELQVLLEFLDTFDYDGEVTRFDFHQYYELVHITCASDRELDKIIASTWSEYVPADEPLAITSTESRAETPVQQTLLSTSDADRINELCQQTQTVSLAEMSPENAWADKSYKPYTSSHGLSSPVPGSSRPASRLKKTPSALPGVSRPLGYDPSHDFSFSSPVSIGVRDGQIVAPQQVLLKPRSNAVSLVRSYFTQARPLPLLRRALMAVTQTGRVSHDAFIEILSRFCPTEYAHMLWSDLAAHEGSTLEMPDVAVDDVMRALRPREPTPRRVKIVDDAFSRISGGQDTVPLEWLRRAYNVISPLSSRSKSKESHDICSFFSDEVTRDQFQTYYADLGATIDDDPYFVLMVWSEWNL